MARRVISQKTKFAYAVEKLPTKVTCKILDSMPKLNPYNTLRQTILPQTSESIEKKLTNLFSNISMENRTPSQLLRHMRHLLAWEYFVSTMTEQTTKQCDPNFKSLGVMCQSGETGKNSWQELWKHMNTKL